MGEVRLNVRLLANTALTEEVVAMAAKLCYSGAQIGDLFEKVSNTDQAAFIERLIGMNHLSPVEHPSFTFGIEGVSRALLAQVTRHRIASFSVQSQRYVNQSKNGELSYIIPPAIRNLGDDAQAEFAKQMQTIHGWYDQWVERLGGKNETSHEDARFVLPNAAETKMMVTMNARELRHFFSLRCCKRAQWEIRAMAWVMLGLCMAKAPQLFGKTGPNCVSGKCTEGAKTCGLATEVKESHNRLVEFVEVHKLDADFESKMNQWVIDNIQ